MDNRRIHDGFGRDANALIGKMAVDRIQHRAAQIVLFE